MEFAEERKQARRGGRLRIDYVGISLIAIGFACLEVVLDRGERDDWLESHFIAAFLAIAVVAIAVAIWWEWRHDDPVVQLTCCGNATSRSPICTIFCSRSDFSAARC